MACDDEVERRRLQALRHPRPVTTRERAVLREALEREVRSGQGAPEVEFRHRHRTLTDEVEALIAFQLLRVAGGRIRVGGGTLRFISGRVAAWERRAITYIATQIAALPNELAERPIELTELSRHLPDVHPDALPRQVTMAVELLDLSSLSEHDATNGYFSRVCLRADRVWRPQMLKDAEMLANPLPAPDEVFDFSLTAQVARVFAKLIRVHGPIGCSQLVNLAKRDYALETRAPEDPPPNASKPVMWWNGASVAESTANNAYTRARRLANFE